MKKYWFLFWYFRKMQLMKMVEYRSNFLFWTIVSLLWTAFNYFFFNLFFAQKSQLAGWSYLELQTVLSFFTMLDAFTWSVFYPNMSFYTQAIFSGELSKYLLQPTSSVFLFTTQHATYHNVPRFLVGLAILIQSVVQLEVHPTVGEIVAATVLFCTSIIFIYTGWFFTATLTFWVERFSNSVDIMPGLRRIYQIPRQLYTGTLSFILTLVFPLGLVTTLPSEILLQKNSSVLYSLYFVFFTIIFGLGTYAFYKRSITKYTGVGG